MTPERYFFFSYARENRRNADRERSDGATFNLVDAFFDRLCRSVSDITNAQSKKVGYRDISTLKVSAPWPQDLVQEMQVAQVLIALVSPHYLSSVNCGREFEVFVRRFNLMKVNAGQDNIPSPIIPIFWINDDQCWPYATPRARCFLEGFQLTGPGLPDDYPSVGVVRQRLLGKPQHYDSICLYLADRIKELAERTPPLPVLDGINDFRLLPSAFDPNQTDDKPVEPTPTAPVFNLNQMPAPPGIAGGRAPPALDLVP